ncbi:TylF/MycF/NovP-related O-methyltransferase [Enterocloster bolteae]|uniref:TylF/MycF/NovP-related O-methyltransferase n=1 Tax=Enterocloster bolteae TaxID=208479 RepID=UPI002A7EC94B|nr:TylF/MycF/NovP-related O-methyltransferase [Enterocloster bolteae]
MKQAVIYGASATGQNLYERLKDTYNIMYFVDGDARKHNSKVFGLEIKPVEEVIASKPDVIIMGILTGWQDGMEYLVSEGFPEERIITKYVDLATRARKNFLEKAANIVKEIEKRGKGDVSGSVAELGVYRGDFAKEINSVFSDRRLYLYDTFDGFPEKDLSYEIINGLLLGEAGKLSNTSVEYVLSRMPYKDRCVVRKGYFPESASDDDETFVFVSIDVDLYKPTLAGLEYFWPRMSRNGYILVHDYFSYAYEGARKAIDEFSVKYKTAYVPIGDTCSIAFVKN